MSGENNESSGGRTEKFLCGREVLRKYCKARWTGGRMKREDQEQERDLM